jgi:hypothetical protein
VLARYTGNAASVIALNRGDAVRVSLPLEQLPLAALRWSDADSGAGCEAPRTLTLPACGSRIWLADAAQDPTADVGP